MNLDNWQRREMGATATYGDQVLTRYYGYSTESNPADTDANFSIRKISISASGETSTWSDNSQANFNAKWSERAANFTAPSGALGFTYSGTNPLYFSWNRLSGVNQYTILVTNDKGFITTPSGYVNTGSQQTCTYRYFNTTNHRQDFEESTGTYSIVLQATNAAGTITATYSYSS